VLRRGDVEEESAGDGIRGPPRSVRLAPHYSKPCIRSAPAKIARGGHFTHYGKLHAPEFLYLMHLKFADFCAYAEAMDRRNGVTADIGAGVKDTAIGRHWFAEARGEDRAVFEAFADMPMEEGFDLGYVRKRMNRSFGPRGSTGYYEFARPDYKVQYKLPERFNGIF